MGNAMGTPGYRHVAVLPPFLLPASSLLPPLWLLRLVSFRPLVSFLPPSDLALSLVAHSSIGRSLPP
jgi:hypothetical protein